MGNDCKNKMTLVQSLRYCRNDTCGIKTARNGSVCFGVLGCRPLPSLYLCSLFPRLRVSVSPFPLATAYGFCPQNSPSWTAQSQYPPCRWHVDYFLRSQILLLWLLQQNIHFYCYCKHFRRASKVSIRRPRWTRKSHVQYWAGWSLETRPCGAGAQLWHVQFTIW